jgi:hypothetical protein
VKVSAPPLKLEDGVYVKDPSALRVTLPLAGPVARTAVALLTE